MAIPYLDRYNSIYKSVEWLWSLNSEYMSFNYELTNLFTPEFGPSSCELVTDCIISKTIDF